MPSTELHDTGDITLVSSDSTEKLSQALRALRKKAGLKQSEMTVAGSQASRAEAGKIAPRWSTIAQWLEDCDASIHDLADLLEPPGNDDRVPSTCERTHASLLAIMISASLGVDLDSSLVEIVANCSVGIAPLWLIAHHQIVMTMERANHHDHQLPAVD